MIIDNVIYTRVMDLRKTKRLETMLHKALECFSELNGKAIAVGYTQQYGEADTDRFIIRLNPRNLSYYVIGHELTHLVQSLGKRLGGRAIPAGEVACDIWTIARSELFLDEPPGYLDVGPAIHSEWKTYREHVRRLCIQAIAKRNYQRAYIRWLIKELHALT